MTFLLCVAALVAGSETLAAAEPGNAPFPLPPGGTETAVAAADHKTVHLEQPFARVEKHYRKLFANAEGVSVVTEAQDGAPALVVVSKRRADGWGKAVLTPDGKGTRLRLTPMFRLDALTVGGNPPPWVGVVLTRSPEARRAVDEQDHLVKR